MMITSSWLAPLRLNFFKWQFVFWASFSVLFECKADDRLAVPDKDVQANSYAKVTDVFKAEITAAKNPSLQTALAVQLLKVASETKDDPTTRFAILQLAVETAKKASDLNIVFSAIDEIANIYDVDVFDSKFEAFSSFAPLITTGNFPNVHATLKMFVTQSVVADRFDIAKSVADRMGMLMKKLRNLSFRAEVNALHVVVEKLAKAHVKSLDAAKKLENPEIAEDDFTAANLILGRYHISKGDWATALPFVAHSNDFRYSKLADSELSGEATFANRLAIADGWWDLAEKDDSLVKRQLQLHSVEIYRNLIGEATGFAKKQIESRIAKISVNTGGLEDLLAAESKNLNAVKIANAANSSKPLAGQGNAERPKQQAANIKIISAKWGGGQNWADVTKRVQELVDARGWVWASPDGLKSDPTPYWRKKLQIEYEVDGKRSGVWIEEDRAWETETYMQKK